MHYSKKIKKSIMEIMWFLSDNDNPFSSSLFPLYINAIFFFMSHKFCMEIKEANGGGFVVSQEPDYLHEVFSYFKLYRYLFLIELIVDFVFVGP